MVVGCKVKKDGKYRFSLQFGSETDEEYRAGEFLEHLGNKKSAVIIAALNEYLLSHPELQSPYCKIEVKDDYILIDCMPSLGMMTINALVAADSVIIPSQPNFLSTKGLNLLLRSISKVKRSINPNLRVEGILLTMVDSRTNNAKDIISSLRQSVGQNIRVFDTEIPHSVRAAESALAGVSIFTHDKNGKVAAAYENLTKEVSDIGREEKVRSGFDWVR